MKYTIAMSDMVIHRDYPTFLWGPGHAFCLCHGKSFLKGLLLLPSTSGWRGPLKAHITPNTRALSEQSLRTSTGVPCSYSGLIHLISSSPGLQLSFDPPGPCIPVLHSEMLLPKVFARLPPSPKAFHLMLDLASHHLTLLAPFILL